MIEISFDAAINDEIELFSIFCDRLHPGYSNIENWDAFLSVIAEYIYNSRDLIHVNYFDGFIKNPVQMSKFLHYFGELHEEFPDKLILEKK